jgi:hypothetical protein
LSGTRQSLCRGPTRPSAKKSNHNGAVSRDGVFAEGLYHRPSAKKLSRIFFKKFFAEGYKEALGKDCTQEFFCKFLCRGLWRRPSAKTQSLPRAMVKALGKETENFISNLFFTFHPHKHFIYIYISTITYVYHAQSNFSQYITTIIMKPQIIISQPYYKSQHVHHHSHVYYNKFIKSKHKSQL